MDVYPEGTCLSVDFGIGTMHADFHNFGKLPFEVEIFVRERATYKKVASLSSC